AHRSRGEDQEDVGAQVPSRHAVQGCRERRGEAGQGRRRGDEGGGEERGRERAFGWPYGGGCGPWRSQEGDEGTGSQGRAGQGDQGDQDRREEGAGEEGSGEEDSQEGAGEAGRDPALTPRRHKQQTGAAS